MNLTDIQKLSDNDLRIKVAELLGYTHVIPNGSANPFHDPVPAGCPPNGNGNARVFLPNYPQDLNACHEMEDKLPLMFVEKYWAVLTSIRKHPHLQYAELSPAIAISATARQRCEAFVACHAE